MSIPYLVHRLCEPSSGMWFCFHSHDVPELVPSNVRSTRQHQGQPRPHSQLSGRPRTHVPESSACISENTHLLECKKWKSPGRVRLFATPWTIASMELSRPEYRSMDSCSLLQGIFPTQGSNPGLPHWGQILYQMSHKDLLKSLFCHHHRKMLINLVSEYWKKYNCHVLLKMHLNFMPQNIINIRGGNKAGVYIGSRALVIAQCLQSLGSMSWKLCLLPTHTHTHTHTQSPRRTCAFLPLEYRLELSHFLGRLIRSLGVPKERGVWNSQGGGKDKPFFPSLHSLGLYNNNVSCLRTVSGLNLLVNSVILKCKLWE